ncbi:MULTISPECIES: TonB-dependent receptor domain-containing protein [unclassified Blastomonas]|uniref:TonB-dependent receptor domain-containing protein n=1 Tax=unclassified Blastomonas TaxID=2626550 RepID=UPI001F37659B|nr:MULTISPECIES: TonB-dependent receptor [unclassified Blastomonas]
MVSPAAFAQEAPAQPTQDAAQPAAEEPDAEEPAQEEIEISGPGAGGGSSEIVVRGRFIPNPIRATSEVLSVLSEADIARTADGDIAGSLQRVTGLSVVGGRFVFVRGLGERYSLALMNGSPLTSPDPLRRTVPLDIFPTSVIASTTIQKSYSVDYPGEFGGGAINLTTKSVPRDPFFKIEVGTGGDTITTGEVGYTYFGSSTDFTGFDNGARTLPRNLRNAFASGNPISVGANFTAGEVRDLTASLANANTALIQRNNNIPVNFSGQISGATSFLIGDVNIGIVGATGINNTWRTRGGVQQISQGIVPVNGVDTLNPDIDFRYLTTENRIVVNGLLGITADVGEHKFKLTNVFIRDTLKDASIREGIDARVTDTRLINRSRTNWFERQLMNTQFVGEMKFDDFRLNFRGSYANSQREAPYERTFDYTFNAVAGDFVNDLQSAGEGARIAFSDLDDNVYGANVDLAYDTDIGFPITFSAGYAYYKNDRTSIRRDFRFLSGQGPLPFAVSQQRPDFLLSDFNVYTFDVRLVETSGTNGAAAYDAGLEVHAGYLQFEAKFTDTLKLQAGVRYEDGSQFVLPIDLFGLGSANLVATSIKKDDFLPAATLTWNLAEDMQVRFAASKTIARPQFRELAPQQYLDLEFDRTFFGNPFLKNSRLINLEARYEYFFGRDERVTAAIFYKDIKDPIENLGFRQGDNFFTTFANAPTATLYGAEIELVKYFDLIDLGGTFFEERRLLIAGNYTYTNSDVKVTAQDQIADPLSGNMVAASTIFRTGGFALTGQSDHIANMQVGLEGTGERLSQQTILLSWNSNRVTNRGPAGQPDFVEYTGPRLDFVWREGFKVFNKVAELKFEARNLLGTDYVEFQQLNTSTILNNAYDIGRAFSISASLQF